MTAQQVGTAGLVEITGTSSTYAVENYDEYAIIVSEGNDTIHISG